MAKRKLKMLLNLGTDDAARFKCPPYEQDEVIDVNERVAELLLKHGVAEEVKPEPAAK